MDDIFFVYLLHSFEYRFTILTNSLILDLNSFWKGIPVYNKGLCDFKRDNVFVFTDDTVSLRFRIGLRDCDYAWFIQIDRMLKTEIVDKKENEYK